MLSPDLKARVRWFAAHAGYGTPPGRMVCARELAEAELWAESQPWLVVEWVIDRDGPYPDFCADAREARRWENWIDRGLGEVVGCVVYGSGRQVLASLWGILELCRNANDRHEAWDYRRVIEAELVREIMPSALDCAAL